MVILQTTLLPPFLKTRHFHRSYVNGEKAQCCRDTNIIRQILKCFQFIFQHSKLRVKFWQKMLLVVLNINTTIVFLRQIGQRIAPISNSLKMSYDVLVTMHLHLIGIKCNFCDQVLIYREYHISRILIWNDYFYSLCTLVNWLMNVDNKNYPKCRYDSMWHMLSGRNIMKHMCLYLFEKRCGLIGK